MKHIKLLGVCVYCTWFLHFMLSAESYSQEVSDIKSLCNNLTVANRLMAEKAGYDLDMLCNEVDSLVSSRQFVQPPASIERETVSSSEDISVTVAPVAVSGVGSATSVSELRPFGYDLFANAPTTYAPASSIPVSSDYLLGPGDTLDILFYGKLNNSFSIEINREGFVDFPELGPVGLAGLTYSEAKEMLQRRISAQIIGTQVSISMGSLRSMQIFVLGEAFKPGAYTVSSLSTITHALVSSGGVSDIGSLRNIQLKRRGKVIASLDLYDLLLAGDTSKDIRVQPADVIYIPTVGDLVSIEGQILRPAIYELKGGETIEDLVKLAGNLGPKAFPKSSKLERINNDGFMTVFDLDLTQSRDKTLDLRRGDHLTINAITDYKKNIVTLLGAVRHDGEFSWHKGIRISDLIPDKDTLSPSADVQVGLLVRELENAVDIEILIFNLENIFSDLSVQDNLELQPRDKVIVLSAHEDRAEVLKPYIDNLKRQSSLGELPKTVRSGGTVRYPGEYPLSENMVIQDLIVLSGGLLESAYSQSAEISRLDLSDPNRAVNSIIVSDLTSKNVSVLEASDYVEFRTIPDYRASETITLEGEFLFPGVYVLERGEMLSSVIERAGGFTDDAFIDGAIFLRESLKNREQAEVDRLLKLLTDQLAANSLRDANSELVIDEGRISAQRGAILSLSNAVATGRLVVPLSKIMASDADDLLLKGGDRLLVPKLSQEVTVIGEVRRPTSYMFDPSFNQIDYIKQSGGFKERADERSVYVVKASGEVVIPNPSLFRFQANRTGIGPGDTIVVPLDTNDRKIRGIPLIAEVSQIVYQLALGSAAIRSFNNN